MGFFFWNLVLLENRREMRNNRTSGNFSFLFFFWNLVLLKNRSRSRVLVLLETNGKGNSRESRVQKFGSKVAAPSPMLG